MGASTSMLLMKKDSTILMEALKDMTENGSKSLHLLDLPALDAAFVESLVSIARLQAGPQLLAQQLEHFSIKECRMRVSPASSPSSATAAMQLLTRFLNNDCTSLQEIDLSKNDLNNEDLAILCNDETGLGAHPTLKSLYLRGNRFQGLEGGQCLRQLLTQDDSRNPRPKLVKLDMSENIWLGLHGIRALSMGLSTNQECLQELILRDCLLDDICVAMLVTSMIPDPSKGIDGGGRGVKILDLARNHLTPAALRSLARLLTAPNTCLEILNVSHNYQLFDEDIRRVEARAGGNLDNDNEITMASCVRTFASALKRNDTVHHLNVQHCGIENLGARYIFRALETNTSVRVLDIGNPNIRCPTGMDYMIQSLPKMKGVEHVKIFIMSTPSPYQQECLVRALQQNTTLCSLASYCEWTQETCFQMEKVFFRNTSMARVQDLLQVPHYDASTATTSKPARKVAPPVPSVWVEALGTLGRNAGGSTAVFQVLRAMLPSSLNEDCEVATSCIEVDADANNSSSEAGARRDKTIIPLGAINDRVGSGATDPHVSSKANDFTLTPSTMATIFLWLGCLCWKMLHQLLYSFVGPVHALNNRDAFFTWWEVHSAQAIVAIHAKNDNKRSNAADHEEHLAHEKVE